MQAITVECLWDLNKPSVSVFTQRVVFVGLSESKSLRIQVNCVHQ